jgi:hypothetical protein
MVDEKTLSANAHISDRELETDIADTQGEIDNMRRLAKAYKEMSEYHSNPYERKMADFRYTATINGINERVEFVKKLVDLLNSRKAQ